MKRTLTPSMDNYLEYIYELGKDGQSVRVKDVASKMHVRMASVTGALQNLAKIDLVRYLAYQNIVLSPQGEEQARCIYNRRRIITSFLEDAWGVAPEVAEDDACKLEHVLSRKTMDGLLKFMVRHKYLSVSEKTPLITLKKERKSRMIKSLSQLLPGEKGVVAKVVGSGAIHRRIVDMGIVPGTTIKVQKFAPLGDPMEIKVKGFNLSLRKSEAETIQIEIA